MKKTIMLIAALILGNLAMAGNFDLSIGPKIGYQTSKLSYKKADIKNGFKNNFTIGAFGRIEIGNLYVQPEILYFKSENDFSLKLNDQDASTLGVDPNLSLTLNTMNLQVPIMVGFKVLDLDLLTLRAQVGPTANFVLKDETLFNANFSGSETNKPEFDTKNINWGLQAGLGVDMMKFTLDINYSFGLSKIFESGVIDNTIISNYVNEGNIDNTKQNVFMVTVGFKLL
jgi:hypothetical protein